MIKLNKLNLLLLLAVLSFGLHAKTPDHDTQNQNTLLTEWTGPYGGVPAFDKMKLSDVKPAFKVAMAENLADYEKIANNKEPATFGKHHC